MVDLTAIAFALGILALLVWCPRPQPEPKDEQA